MQIVVVIGTGNITCNLSITINMYCIFQSSMVAGAALLLAFLLLIVMNGFVLLFAIA